MRIKDLEGFLRFSIENKFPVLLTGSPGIGKTSIVEQAAALEGARVISEFLSISDPIDFKGALFAENGVAEFLPAGTLNEIINTDEKIVFFLDDIGQGTPATQAAAMQLIHSRKIGGIPIGKNVVFMGATNRAKDGAGVNYLIEPLKSRFKTIIEVEVNTDDWIRWAIQNGMPESLIGFIRFRPEMLNDFKPTRDITNSSNPRSVASIGEMVNRGLEKSLYLETFKGAAGESFSLEFTSYLKMSQNLPNIDELMNKPTTSVIPEEPAIKYAVFAAMGSRAKTEEKFSSAIQYCKRMGPEFEVAIIRDVLTRYKELQSSDVFSRWASENHERI